MNGYGMVLVYGNEKRSSYERIKRRSVVTPDRCGILNPTNGSKRDEVAGTGTEDQAESNRAVQRADTSQFG